MIVASASALRFNLSLIYSSTASIDDNWCDNSSWLIFKVCRYRYLLSTSFLHNICLLSSSYKSPLNCCLFVSNSKISSCSLTIESSNNLIISSCSIFWLECSYASSFIFPILTWRLFEDSLTPEIDWFVLSFYFLISVILTYSLSMSLLIRISSAQSNSNSSL